MSIKYVCHSGGAEGADHFFGLICDEYHFNAKLLNKDLSFEVRHYFHKRKTPYGNIDVSNKEIDYGWEQIKKANQILRRSGIEKFKPILARNAIQEHYSDVIYAVGYLEGLLDNCTISGGTAWACTLGILNNKPVYLFDQNTKHWYLLFFLDKFIANKVDDPKIIKYNFAGIGSRDLKDSGRQAIVKLFSDTFKE